MKHLIHLVLVAGLLTIAGCFAGPVGFDDFDSGSSAGVTISHGQVSTLSATEFEIAASDAASSLLDGIGDAQIEFRHADAGMGEWESSNMEAYGSRHRASHTFMSSGDYLWRIVEAGNDDGRKLVLHESTGRIHVERAHADAGGYRVEYESYPGHVREGMTAMVSFWVFGSDGYDYRGDDDHDDGYHHGGMGGMMGHDGDHHGDDNHDDGDHQGDDCHGDVDHGDDYHHGDDGHGGMGQNWIAGLETAIGPNSMGGGHMRDHSMREEGQGRYSAEHLFAESGEARLTFRFRAQDGSETTTEFRVPVAAR